MRLLRMIKDPLIIPLYSTVFENVSCYHKNSYLVLGLINVALGTVKVVIYTSGLLNKYLFYIVKPYELVLNTRMCDLPL